MKAHYLSMRLLCLLAAILIVGTAAADVQTLDEMGIDARVGKFDDARTWEIPYEFGEDCTAFFTAILKAGELRVFDGNELVLHAKKPGKYRVLLRGRGLMRIALRRVPGEGEASLDGGSFIACDRVPVVTLEVNVPETWSVGGYTPVTVRLVNRGTADAEGFLVLESPWNAAPLRPPGKIRVPAGGEKEITITMLTLKENNKVLFPRQCFEYRDKYGRVESCADSSVFAARKAVPVGCIDRENGTELFNMGYLDLELGPEVIPPRKSAYVGLREGPGEEICAIKVQIQKMPFTENPDVSLALAAILATAGIIGILASEKKLKSSRT